MVCGDGQAGIVSPFGAGILAARAARRHHQPLWGWRQAPIQLLDPLSAPSGLAAASWVRPSTPSGLAILLPQLHTVTLSPFGAGCRFLGATLNPFGVGDPAAPALRRHHQPLRGWPPGCRSCLPSPSTPSGLASSSDPAPRSTVSPFGAGILAAEAALRHCQPLRGCRQAPIRLPDPPSAPMGLAIVSWVRPSTPSGLPSSSGQAPRSTLSPYGAGLGPLPSPSAPTGLALGRHRHHQPLRGWPWAAAVNISPFGAGPGMPPSPSAPSGLALGRCRHRQPLRGWPWAAAVTISPYGAGPGMLPSPSAPSGLALGRCRHHQPLRGWPWAAAVTISPFGAGFTFAMMCQPLRGWCRGGLKPLKRSFSGLKRGWPFPEPSWVKSLKHSFSDLKCGVLCCPHSAEGTVRVHADDCGRR